MATQNDMRGRKGRKSLDRRPIKLRSSHSYCERPAVPSFSLWPSRAHRKAVILSRSGGFHAQLDCKDCQAGLNRGCGKSWREFPQMQHLFFCMNINSLMPKSCQTSLQVYIPLRCQVRSRFKNNLVRPSIAINSAGHSITLRSN